jgi:hypothetical protein
METVILFVNMVIILKVLVPVPLENLFIDMVFAFLHVKMINNTKKILNNAHADLVNHSTNMDSVKQHAILMAGLAIQNHAHVHTVRSTPTTGMLRINIGIIPVRDYVRVTPSMVVKAILLALLVTFTKIITNSANLILIAFVTGII